MIAAVYVTALMVNGKYYMMYSCLIYDGVCVIQVNQVYLESKFKKIKSFSLSLVSPWV